MAALMGELCCGAFTYAPPALPLLARAVEIDRAYGTLRIGLVDASIVALAEELGITRLATRDVRHFSAIKVRDGRAFDLVVRPSRPDRAPARRRQRGNR